MTQPALATLRIIDLTRYIAGPYCTRLLAGLGAEVIKVEKPGQGDPARAMRPFFQDEPGLESSGLFLYLNSNKKSVTLNLKSETGQGILKELVKDADIIIEDFRPGKMAEYGLNVEILHELNPRLVMTSISAFGQTGPYRDYRINHLTAWGMSGARYNDGAPGVRPVQIGGWLTHYITGLFATTGSLTGIFRRNQMGTGCHVDISMWESNILITCYPTVIYSYQGLVHNGISKERFGIFECKDGYIGLNLYGRLNWELLVTFLGIPEILTDPRFSTPQGLVEHYEEGRAIVAEKIRHREKMELFQSGVEWRIPFGLVPTTQEVMQSPQHEARGFFESVRHPVAGEVLMPGAPFKMAETPWQLKTPAPLLGEHNEAIYCGRLGYAPDDMVRLRERGII